MTQINGGEGAAEVYALFATVLLSVPDDEVCANMARLLEAAEDEDAAEADAGAVLEGEALVQRFYDRLVVAVSPLYLPAIESRIADAREEADGRLEPGHADGPRMTEVLACYRTYGFDHRALAGFAPLVGSLRADQLQAELAFMAHLRRLQAQGGTKGQAAGQFAGQFLERHLLSWVPTLCVIARQRGAKDVYVRLLDAVVRWLETDAAAAS